MYVFVCGVCHVSLPLLSDEDKGHNIGKAMGNQEVGTNPAAALDLGNRK